MIKRRPTDAQSKFESMQCLDVQFMDVKNTKRQGWDVARALEMHGNGSAGHFLAVGSQTATTRTLSSTFSSNFPFTLKWGFPKSGVPY